MTIFFPDISSYEAGLTIQPGTVAVIAKATEGTYYQDAYYAGFKAQGARVGAVFSAYHFLKAGNGAAQADYCHAMVGATPVMLDVETEGASLPNELDCLAFINRMRELGGRVWGAYFPAWFWQQVGGSLASLGVAVVSSNYTAYSDTGPGWAPYGGATPVIWQYTNAQSYGGQRVDFNAFRGTVAELAALIYGGSSMATIPDSIAHHFAGLDLSNDFPPNGTWDPNTAEIWADARAEAAYRQAALNGQKLDQLLARQAPTADQIGAAVAEHLSGGGGASAANIAAAVDHLFAQKLGA